MKNVISKKSPKGRINTRPIDRFYNCFKLDIKNGVDVNRCNGINNQQWRAADRLSSNYERAFLGWKGGITEPKVDCSLFRSTKIDIQIQALCEHKRIFSKLNRSSQDIIAHVCFEELPLRKYESMQLPKLKKGHGMICFRKALDELTEIYRVNA